MSETIKKMNGSMKRSYLVQRLQLPKGYSGISFGGGLKDGGVNKEAMEQLDKIFSFDYMGAAEFEFGALADTLAKISQNTDDFVKNSMKVHWKTSWRSRTTTEGDGEVYYLCHKDQEKEIKKRIKVWATGGTGGYGTKEFVGLDMSFTDESRHAYRGWIELDNGFFFFIDKDMCDKTSELFEVE